MSETTKTTEEVVVETLETIKTEVATATDTHADELATVKADLEAANTAIETVKADADASIEAIKTESKEALETLEAKFDSLPTIQTEEIQMEKSINEQNLDIVKSVVSGEVKTADLTKALSPNVDGDGKGGTEVMTPLSRALLEGNVLRQHVKVSQTAGSSYKRPMLSGAAGTAFGNAPTSATDSYDVTEMEIKLIKQHAFVALDEDFLADVTNAESVIMQDLFEDMAASEAAAMISGNGSTAPLGLDNLTVGAAAVQSTGTFKKIDLAGTSTATYNEVMDAIYALAPRYRANAKIMCSTGMIAELRKLADANDNPLWADSVIAGQPATFAGYPVIEFSHMTAPATSETAFIVGDFAKGLEIVDRTTVSVDKHSNVTLGSEVIYARKRVGMGYGDVKALIIAKFA